MSKKSMSLKDWINFHGVEHVARKMKVTGVAVRQWRRGHCLPKSDQMLKIKRLSHRAVTIDNMVETHFSK